MMAPLGQRITKVPFAGGRHWIPFYPKGFTSWSSRINPLFLRKWRGPRRRGRAVQLARRAARARLTPREIDRLVQATIKSFRQTTASKLPWWTKGTSTFELLVNRALDQAGIGRRIPGPIGSIGGVDRSQRKDLHHA